MIALQLVLVLLAAAAALWLVARPLFRPAIARTVLVDIPDPEETRKGVALLALREIEFDRETGKLSDGDYERLKRAYTSEALTALRVEEGKAARGSEAVESLVAARARQLARRVGGVSAAAGIDCATCGPRPEADAIFCSSCGRLLAGEACRKCGAALRPDSRFCEACGTPVAGAA